MPAAFCSRACHPFRVVSRWQSGDVRRLTLASFWAEDSLSALFAVFADVDTLQAVSAPRLKSGIIKFQYDFTSFSCLLN